MISTSPLKAGHAELGWLLTQAHAWSQCSEAPFLCGNLLWGEAGEQHLSKCFNKIFGKIRHGPLK